MTQFKPLLPTFLFTLMLALLVGCGVTDTRSDTAGEYVEDAVITTRINAAIFDDPDLRNADVDVETVNGEVRLSGRVDSQEKSDALNEIAEEADGVSSVQNDILIE